MAYTDTTGSQRRNATVIAVAALHGAAIYALITGLGVDFVKETITRIEARNIPATEPEPPPQPVTPPQQSDLVPPEISAPAPDIRLPSDNSIVVVRDDDALSLPEIAYIPPRIEPNPTILPPAIEPGPPTFKPVAAKPQGNPGTWFTTSDYPTRDIREGNEGTARFRLALDARGKVASCDIVKSSGHEGLDAATCRVVAKRARFTAATDETGARIAGSYTGSVTWQIPR